MKNLYVETIRAIEVSDHTTAEVDWVGTLDGKAAMLWEKFADIANINYNEQLRAPGIPLDLCIIFTDRSWLERHKDYMDEYWIYRFTPHRRPLCYDFGFKKVEDGLDGSRFSYNFFEGLKRG